jgi:hypothetical protein
MGLIEDGTGTGKTLRVNGANQASVIAESIGAGVYAAIEGGFYVLTSGDLVLSSDNASAALLLKYGGDRSLVISRLIFTIGESTGGASNLATVQFWQNPTDLIGGTERDAINRNFSATDNLVGVKKLGAEGLAFSGGQQFAQQSSSAIGVFDIDISRDPFVLEVSNAIGLSILPPAGNTNATYRLAIFAYEVTL